MVSVTGKGSNNTPVVPGQSYEGIVFDGVGKVLIDNKFVGSAALVNKQFIVTSKHVFPGDFLSDTKSGGTIRFPVYNTKGVLVDEDAVFSAENVFFAPDADLAIIKLDSPPFNIDSYEFYAGAPGSELGQKFVHVGYGVSGDGTKGTDKGLAGTKRWGTNTFEKITNYNDGVGHVLLSDFDSGLADHDAFGNDPRGTGDLEVTATEGDSGGPNFIFGKVAAITKGGSKTVGDYVSKAASGRFGSTEADVQISKYLPWITATINSLTEKNAAKAFLTELEPWSDPAKSVLDVKVVANALVGPQSNGVKIDPLTVKLDGADAVGRPYPGGQHATFESIDFDEGRKLGYGVVLSTGGVPIFAADGGWRNSDEIPASMEGDGDADLDKLVPGYTTHDAATLEFTFKNNTAHNAVTFKVIFGSDEWGEGPDGCPDFAGIFVNGKNYAVFSDGTVLKVTQPTPSDATIFGPAPRIEYDGLTRTLLIIAEVRAGDNTVKIAVADAHARNSSGSGDSALFVSDMQLVTLPTGVTGMLNIIDGLNDGTWRDDLINGDDTGNTLNGGGGGDLLIGKNGNDVFNDVFGNNFFDGGEGFDTIDYSLLSNGVTVDLEKNVSLNYSVSAYQTTPTTSAKDKFTGIEAVIGTSSNDNLYGNVLGNVLKGGAGVDYLDGRGGADTLVGGTESDVYYVDNAGDVITEKDGEGTDDYVYSTISLRLAAHVEHLTLSGTKGLTGIGNDLNNKLNGTIGNDTLAGLGGADKLMASGGNDTVTYEASTAGVKVSLATNKAFGGHAEGDTFAAVENITGSPFDDVIEGHADNNAVFGNNILNGGLGVDTASYFNATGKVKVSLALTSAQVTGGAGTDTLLNFENLTGSAFDDTLTGSSGANVLNGGAGADTMAGGAGDDIYVVDNARDIVREKVSEGADTVRSAISDYTLVTFVERLELIGSALNGTGSSFHNRITGNDLGNTLKGEGGDDTIFGGSGKDVIDGGSGKDVITGGLDADTLYGGLDSDTFVFTNVNDSLAGSNGLFNSATGDVIDRFERGRDKINLSAIDAHTGLGGDQPFHFGWDGRAGALTVTSVATTVAGSPGYANHVFADVGGDGKADLVFVALSYDKLTVTDFIL